eukprot:GDKK01035098.1.p1 GENE.GDKK01035098.1~~GDKK01035098.1.p1  ORF type:complete len:485 (+),score=86.81 GDKK01035098.1:57-1457(+)
MDDEETVRCVFCSLICHKPLQLNTCSHIACSHCIYDNMPAGSTRLTCKKCLASNDQFRRVPHLVLLANQWKFSTPRTPMELALADGKASSLSASLDADGHLTAPLAKKSTFPSAQQANPNAALASSFLSKANQQSATANSQQFTQPSNTSSTVNVSASAGVKRTASSDAVPPKKQKKLAKTRTDEDEELNDCDSFSNDSNDEDESFIVDDENVNSDDDEISSYASESDVDDSSESDVKLRKCDDCEQGHPITKHKCSKQTKHVKCGFCPRKFPITVAEKENKITRCAGCATTCCMDYYGTCQGKYAHPLKLMGEVNYDHVKIGDNLKFLAKTSFHDNQFEAEVTLESLKNARSHVTPAAGEKTVCSGVLFSDLMEDTKDKVEMEAKTGKKVQVNKDDMLCYDCQRRAYAAGLWRWRLSDTFEQYASHWLPNNAKNRSKCWYGWNCRTMAHKQAHAESLNHCCKPTK